MSQKILYVVDDNPEFRRSVEWLLQAAGFEVRGFGHPGEALARIVEHLESAQAAPICILLDVRMPEMSGLGLHDALRAKGHHPPVIYMTGHGDVPLAVEAMKKGAVTFLEKPFDDAALQAALEAAFSGDYRGGTAGATASPPVPLTGEGMGEAPEEGRRIYQERYATLTPREREVLQGIVDGKLNKVIADRLDISIKTVEVHRARLMKKLQARTLPELVKMVLTGCVEQPRER